MRKQLFLLTLLLFCLYSAYAQPSLQHRASQEILIYRISAGTAEKYMRERTIDPDAYLHRIPFGRWTTGSAKYEDLPTGNYILLSVVENDVKTAYYCQSSIHIFPINNQHRVQLEVRDSLGNPAAHARVWADQGELKYDKGIGGFEFTEKRPGGAIIRVTLPGDTLFMYLDAKEDLEKNSWQQWWTNLGYTRMGRWATWPYQKLKQLLVSRSNYGRSGRYRSNHPANGYMVFNKPRYLPGDTLKFKAFVVNKRGKPYNKSLSTHLQYMDHGAYIDKAMGSLGPRPAGAFTNEFVLGDSLSSDNGYSLSLRAKNKREKIRGVFKIEDYVLDEVSSYELRAAKDHYLKRDTLVFYASASDANGMTLMDGRVNLCVLAKSINSFYRDREFVPDTLWKGESPLAVEGETRFEIPTAGFPEADLSLKIVAEFRNSNNEIHEKKLEISLTSSTQFIRVRKEGHFLQADFMQDGKPVAREGYLSVDDDGPEKKMKFPYRQRLNPYHSNYCFMVKNDTGANISKECYVPLYNYSLSFSRIHKGDTAGFYLNNPERIPVHYTVSYGSKILFNGSDTSEWIEWRRILPKKRSYAVDWNYIWAGEERKGRDNIAVLDKILKASIGGARTVYPGQRDTISIAVTDYKGRPVQRMNLTAVSYNHQFSKDIRLPEPPYLSVFKTRRKILFDNYELSEGGVSMNFMLGQHPAWREVLGLDSMDYYRLLFPGDHGAAVVFPINQFTPQIAVHVVKQGVPQDICLLYINREFVWYNGVTIQGKYAFPVSPGYTQVGIRLRDRYIEIDSLYIQPYYKHELSFDPDHLPPGAKVFERDSLYTNTERRQIEEQVWQLRNDTRTRDGYVWQGYRLVHLPASTASQLVGPFEKNDSLQFFKENEFDFKFPFEHGYEYTLAPKMARLEKKAIFTPGKIAILPVVSKPAWILGDTLVDAPVITYNTRKSGPVFLRPTEAREWGRIVPDAAALTIALPADSSFLFSILSGHFKDTTINSIHNKNLSGFANVRPGRYDLILVTSNFHYLRAPGLDIGANGTFCIRFSQPVYFLRDELVDELRKLQEEEIRKIDTVDAEKGAYRPRNMVIAGKPLPAGPGGVSGIVTDTKGKSPIPGATVTVRGYSRSVQCGVDGHFIIDNIAGGQYILIFSMIGYVSRELSVRVTDTLTIAADIQLTVSENLLEEVIVTGYARQYKRGMTGSISSVMTQSLQGKMLGLAIQGSGEDGARIVIRGVTTSEGQKPLYVINGVPMEELPDGFDMKNAQVNILKGAAAIALYGARASAGAIVVMTAGFIPDKVRDHFRDYAFWQPNLMTDENGEVRFVVTYPDNITGWETYVIGMKKKRILKSSAFTRSFKPVLAQLSTPRFLVEGDSSYFIGKLINYTSDEKRLQVSFKAGGEAGRTSHSLAGNSSFIETLRVVAPSADSITAEYISYDTSGYSDGESRKIPVYRRGTEEAKGNFWVLDRDTTFTYSPEPGPVRFFAQNNTLDVLLDEINHLRDYPYYCMEQTASKLVGLLMEKRIFRSLGKNFKEEKEIQRLISRLQRSQLFDGGWSWWEGGKADIVMTNYITRALILLRGDIQLENNIRNALLFLQNRLPSMKRDDLLSSLYTLGESGHDMNYGQYLDKLPYDSLNMHQQWEIIRIRQRRALPREVEMKLLITQAIPSMMGGIHWGVDSYRWSDNEMATTALAFDVLSKEKDFHWVLTGIMQYFLEQRRNGHWRNTVESAGVVATILPFLLEKNAAFMTPPDLLIAGDTLLHVKTFPFEQVVPGTGQPVTVKKTGGGMVYFTAWQTMFNPRPEPVTQLFNINSWFERTGNRLTFLKAGEKVVMKISVEVMKDAEYVQLEIPIPAGCTYAAKEQAGYREHREFLKNKLVLFIERMNKGTYEYQIELEPRYPGTYHLNPARAELMYFPTFYGRNTMKQIIIDE